MRSVVNDVYQELSKGCICVSDASKKIIECIFRAPHKFGLSHMEEDEKSEFLLFIFTHLEKIIDNYTETLSSFSTYLTNVIVNLRKSWYREYYHSIARHKTVKYFLEKEKSYFASDIEEKYELEREYNNDREAYTSVEVYSLLVLALKSCYYLTPSHISILSKKTGFSEETLYALKEELDSKLTKKIEKHSLESEKINGMYIKKNSCQLELMCIDQNSTIAKRLEQKQMFYTKTWKNHISKLRNFSPVKPSNKQIGEVLHIQEHLVMRLLGEVKKLEKKAYSM